MCFGRAWNPTLGQRKSSWGETQELQKNQEEKQLPPRATSSASHSCAAGPACAWPAALRLAAPSHPGLPVPQPAACLRVLPWR